MMTDEPSDTPSRVTRSTQFHVKQGANHATDDHLHRPARLFWARQHDGASGGRGTTLAAELASLRARGTDLIVFALTEDEQTGLDLLDKGETAAAAGLEYRGAPIPNLDIPVHADIAPTLAYVHGELRRGAHVVVHC
jgi:hypothetical protein